MVKFTKRHYEEMARMIKGGFCSSPSYPAVQYANNWVSVFKADNPLFKPEVFYKACGLVVPPQEFIDSL
jgi:hypothetical protein